MVRAFAPWRPGNDPVKKRRPIVPPPKPPPPDPSWPVYAGGVAIVLAGLAAYHNSFAGTFIFDDRAAIISNPTIRHLGSLGQVFSPPPGSSAGGRPVVNLSLAVNYALSGSQVWSYHVLNLMAHLLAGLFLFGLVRRTLLQPVLRERWGAAALPVAFVTAALWTVHPLQTEAVTYVIQRAEGLMGMFYLLTLYAVVRAAGQPRPGGWTAVAVVSCLLGMASKEVMVSAPVLALLYDRTFIAGSFREAWRQRWRLYLGLAATWVVLGYLVLSIGGDRGGTAGFDVGVAWWAYGLTQFQAVSHYLWLAVWPHPLVFEYGPTWVKHPAEVMPYAIVVVGVVAGTLWALKFRPALGFLGVWFLAILAPTSLVPGTTQMIVEHRMYLPLAAVLVLVVLGLQRLAGKRSLIVGTALVVGAGCLTERRNDDYRSELAMWGDTLAKRPDNARAHHDMAFALSNAGRFDEAVEQYHEALRLKPDDAETHNNLGGTLQRLGRIAEAVDEYHEALRLKPNYAAAHNNLGNTLAQMGRMDEAIAEFQQVVRLDPPYLKARVNLGHALALVGRVDEAIAQEQEVLRLDPENAAARQLLMQYQGQQR